MTLDAQTSGLMTLPQSSAAQIKPAAHNQVHTYRLHPVGPLENNGVATPPLNKSSQQWRPFLQPKSLSSEQPRNVPDPIQWKRTEPTRSHCLINCLISSWSCSHCGQQQNGRNLPADVNPFDGTPDVVLPVRRLFIRAAGHPSNSSTGSLTLH